jgi:large subunit ribosomal protein L26e
VRGSNKGTRGKVIQVARRRFAIHIDKLTKSKANGAPYQVPIHPSNVVITKLKEHKDRLTKITKIAAGIILRKGKGDKKIRTTDKNLA